MTEDQIVTAIQTGEPPDGRILAPIMPWQAFANLTKDDAYAIAAYLKSLKPVDHAVPGPFGAGEKVGNHDVPHIAAGTDFGRSAQEIGH